MNKVLDESYKQSSKLSSLPARVSGLLQEARQGWGRTHLRQGPVLMGKGRSSLVALLPWIPGLEGLSRSLARKSLLYSLFP